MWETWVQSLGLIPGSGKSPGEGNGNPLQYSCLENPMEGGAWWAMVHGVAKSRTGLSDFSHCTGGELNTHTVYRIFSDGSVVKNLPTNTGNTRDVGSIPGLGRSPGEGNGNPLQYSCLENPMDGGAWWARVHGVANSRT